MQILRCALDDKKESPQSSRPPSLLATRVLVYYIYMNRHTNLLQSAGSAVKGAKHGFIGRNFRILVICAAAAISIAYYLPLTSMERYSIILLAALLLAAELFNSAIEELADVVTTEHNPGIARAKELAAGALLVLCLTAGGITLAIILPHF